MSLVVQKYGGSSVSSPERIKRVAKRVVEKRKAGNDVVVVVSALGDTTDELIFLASQINVNPPKREYDMLLATGEQVSIALLAMAIHELNHPVISLTGAQAGIITDINHGEAKIMEICKERLVEELSQGKIVIVAGFQGININNDITTLGRGGSDTTAVAIAVALKAEVCEILTDVDGVYTSDPRIVPNASKLSLISYNEMLELASLGSGILQPRAVVNSKIHNVELCVRSSFNYNEGTIVKEVSNMEKNTMVTGIAFDLNVTKFAVYDLPDKPGLASKIFRSLASEMINVDMIIQSAERGGINAISFTTSKDNMEKTIKVLEIITKEINVSGYRYKDNVAKISIVGAGMITNPGVAAKMFETFFEEQINIQMITASEITISCIINAVDNEKAVLALHKKFKLDTLAKMKKG